MQNNVTARQTIPHLLKQQVVGDCTISSYGVQRLLKLVVLDEDHGPSLQSIRVAGCQHQDCTRCDDTVGKCTSDMQNARQ